MNRIVQRCIFGELTRDYEHHLLRKMLGEVSEETNGKYIIQELSLKNLKLEKENSVLKNKRKNKTTSNEKHSNRERNKIICYKRFDEVMKKCPNMRQSEIKKIIAKELHCSTKTITGYLNERVL